jgi:hypothetical protein
MRCKSRGLTFGAQLYDGIGFKIFAALDRHSKTLRVALRSVNARIGRLRSVYIASRFIFRAIC